MKIKDVCAATNLSARTVRYYIEEGLIFPKYTENYLGRRFFNFSEEDIHALNDIAVLREFGFSIADIRAMQQSGECRAVIEKLKGEKREDIEKQSRFLSALEMLNQKEIPFGDLAQQLKTTSNIADIDKKNEDSTPFVVSLRKIILKIIKMILCFTLAAIPVCFLFYYRSRVLYPVIRGKNIVAILLCLLPTVIICIFSFVRFKKPWRKTGVMILIICIFLQPVSFVGAVGFAGHSETRDIHNYRKFDADCLANRNIHFQELFPAWAHTSETYITSEGDYNIVKLDTKYLYKDRPEIDYTYDIYAEWPLTQEDFMYEIQRVKNLFRRWVSEDTASYGMKTLTKGNYECLFYYNGAEPFCKVNDSYTYCIFAYDKENFRVRYLFCDSLENGADQPYYLELDW